MSNPYRDRNRRPERDDGGGSDRWSERQGSYDTRAQKQRAPLQFEEVFAAEEGQCRGVVTAADGEHDRVYSFTLERIVRERPGRYFRPMDFKDLTTVLTSIKQWFDSQGVSTLPR